MRLSTALFGFCFLFSVSCRAPTWQHQKRVIESQELKLIRDFFNYFATIQRIAFDNEAHMIWNYMHAIFQAIPANQRGPVTDLLKSFLDEIESIREENNFGSSEAANLLIQRTRDFIYTIKEEIAGGRTAEEKMVIKKLKDSRFLLGRLNIEEKILLKKLRAAIAVVLEGFSNEGIFRHRHFYQTLEALRDTYDVRDRLRVNFQMRRLQELYSMT